ncbi:hypothetical protein [Methylobacterium ajmalii]|uniref:hypothetical protein n=1 Tax=Methylobacterium ajmalii TaxID=2738439 RepID=UPI002F35AF40
MMRKLLGMQRQIHDLQQQMLNQDRVGVVTEVKFDKQKNGWYAKMEQGSGDETWRSDWLPWQSFSNGAIKISMPPRKGQRVKLNPMAGSAEMGSLAPYHYDPNNKAPHDKEDELFIRVQKGGEDDKSQTLDMHFTKDAHKVTLGDSTHTLTKDAVSTKTKTASVDSDNHTVKTKNHTLDAENSEVKSARYALSGKVLINC